MSKTKPVNSNLLKQSEAVGEYLDQLLELPKSQSEAVVPLEPASRVDDSILIPPDLLEVKPSLDTENTKVERQKASEAKQPIELKKAADFAEDTSELESFEEPAEVVSNQTQQEDSAVDFEFPLQCLMFQVAGHDLAIPLIKLGGVVPWTDKLTLLPHNPKWFLGILKYRELNVRVIDTGKLLQIVDLDDELKPDHFLVFAETTWAISCDLLGEVKSLQQQDVKWNTGDSKALSHGTIKKSLALLLNPEAIGSHLELQL